jgi:nicotinate-nucleotide adenylyltransferase
VSDLEVRRGGVSYTVDTLEELRRSEPALRTTLLLGADNLAEFEAWRDPERILALSSVVVMTRPGHEVGSHPLVMEKSVTLCPVPDIEVSASDIRTRVRSGRSIHFRVPVPVEEYILANGLYREGT